MGGSLPKQYQLLQAGQPVLWHTFVVLAAEPRLDILAVVVHPDDVWFDQFSWPGGDRLLVLRAGEPAALKASATAHCRLCYPKNYWILAHDAARCCLPRDVRWHGC